MNKNQDPTPAEIEAACREIQKTWSPQERIRRLRCDLRPTVMAADGIACDVGASDYFGHIERVGCDK